MSAQFAWQLTNLAVINFLVTSADLGSHSCLTFVTGQAGLGVFCPGSLACDLAQQGFQARLWPQSATARPGRAGRLTTASRFFIPLGFHQSGQAPDARVVSVVLI